MSTLVPSHIYLWPDGKVTGWQDHRSLMDFVQIVYIHTMFFADLFFPLNIFYKNTY